MRLQQRLVLFLLLVCGAAIVLALRLRRATPDLGQGIVVEGEDYPLRVRTRSGTVVVERRPERILPAFASAVDLLVELVPKERVVALPSTAADWSILADEESEWRKLPVLGSFSAEAVLELQPDLVLVQSWLGTSTIEALERRGLTVLDLPLPNEWGGLIASLRALGRIVGESQRAEGEIAALEERRARLARRASKHWRALCYSNWGAGGTTAGADSTGDLMLELAGLANVAREAGLRGNPSIDHETILALAPDLFVVASAPMGAGNPSSAYLREDEHLARSQAVREGKIVELPMHLFSTGSQHVLDAAEILAAQVDSLFADAHD